MTSYETGYMLGMKKQALGPLEPAMSIPEIWNMYGPDYGLSQSEISSLLGKFQRGGTSLPMPDRAIADALQKAHAVDKMRADRDFYARSARTEAQAKRVMGSAAREAERGLSRAQSRIGSLKKLIGRNKRLALMVGIPLVLGAGVGGYFLGKRRATPAVEGK